MTKLSVTEQTFSWKSNDQRHFRIRLEAWSRNVPIKRCVEVSWHDDPCDFKCFLEFQVRDQAHQSHWYEKCLTCPAFSNDRTQDFWNWSDFALNTTDVNSLKKVRNHDYTGVFPLLWIYSQINFDKSRDFEREKKRSAVVPVNFLKHLVNKYIYIYIYIFTHSWSDNFLKYIGWCKKITIEKNKSDWNDLRYPK